MRTWNYDKIHVGWSACVGFSLMLLLLPFEWCIAVVLAAVFHELCHSAAIYVCGGRILMIRIGFAGAAIEAEPMGDGKELLCALAGPLGGLSLLFLAKWLPRTAICAAIQSLYNLMPIYPLDGGRVLRCGIKLMLPAATAEKVYKALQYTFLAVLTMLILYAVLRLHAGMIPVLFLLILWRKTLKHKNSLQTSS